MGDLVVATPCGKRSCAVGEVLDCCPERASSSLWARHWGLAPRHARVAAYLMRGWSDRRVAEELGLKVTTVRTYAKAILQTSGARNRSTLLIKALKIAYGSSGLAVSPQHLAHEPTKGQTAPALGEQG